MAEKKKGMRRGCVVAIIVVSVLVIGAVALSLVCINNPEKLIEFGLNSIATEIKTHLPDDITPEMIDRQVSDFVQAFKDKKIDQFEIQKVMALGQEIVTSEDLSEEELQEMARIFYEEMQKAIEE